MRLAAKYLFISILIVACSAPQQVPGQAVGVSFQVFYDGLSPYGYWIDYPGYGYAWVPDVGPGFSPYSSDGHWVMTSYGWTWVSYYSWGWAPFHYGRWWYDSFYGWFWVPGTVWGPAWVIWRTSPGYYGWAPLGPNVSITFAIGGGYTPPLDYWCFLPSQYMGRSDINYYYGPRKNTQQFINTSTVINNTYIDNTTHTTYIAGPKQEDVEKATGRSINTVALKEQGEPSQTFKNNELKLYRPVISKEEAGNSDIKPAKITDKKDIQPVAERKTTEQEKKVRSIQPAGEYKERGKEPFQKEEIAPKKEEQQVPKADPGRINPPPEPIEKRPLPEQKVNKPIELAPVQKPLPKTNIEKPVQQPVPQQPKQNIPKRPRNR